MAEMMKEACERQRDDEHACSLAGVITQRYRALEVRGACCRLCRRILRARR